ncbi:MAG: hypothetical protein MRZ84_06720 [Eubacterium sp.]|nr:hypothetical protein [Eubacterium sp.]
MPTYQHGMATRPIVENILTPAGNTERRSDDMRDRDTATKQYMSHKDVVADAFNFYLNP